MHGAAEDEGEALMEPFGKVFKSLFTGSMRGRSDEILVFVNMLASCSAEGIDDRHPKAIAGDVGLSHERVRRALTKLEQVDRESRSADEDGRRIVRLDQHRDWGWRIVNYAKYRARSRESDRREYKREWMRNRRCGQGVDTRGQVKTPVESGGRCGPIAEAEAEADNPLTPKVGDWEGEIPEHLRGHRLAALWVRLRETGKFDHLTIEHLAAIQGNAPGVDMAEQERADYIVQCAESMPSKAIGAPFAWIGARLSEMEMREGKKTKDAGGDVGKSSVWMGVT